MGDIAMMHRNSLLMQLTPFPSNPLLHSHSKLTHHTSTGGIHMTVVCVQFTLINVCMYVKMDFIEL